MFDHPPKALRRSVHDIQPPPEKPSRFKPVQVFPFEHPAAIHTVCGSIKTIARLRQIERTGPVTQNSRARFLKHTTQRAIQRLGQAAQFCMKCTTSAPDFTNRAAKLQPTRCDVGPIDKPGTHLGAVKPTRLNIIFAHSRIGQGPQGFGIIDAQTRALRQSRRRKTCLSTKNDAIKGKIPVVVGKPIGRTIWSCNRPGPAQRGGSLRDMRQEVFALPRHHTRTSTIGTLGTLPA